MEYTTFRRALDATLVIARANGLDQKPPTASYVVKWMEPEPGRSAGRQQTRTEIDRVELSRRLTPLLVNCPEYIALRDEVAVFIERDAKRILPMGTVLPEQCIEALFNRYLEAVGFRVDDSAARSVWHAFRSDNIAATFAARAIYRVQAFRTQAPFALADGISFRPLSAHDIDRYGRSSFPYNLGRPWHWALNTDDWICAITRDVSKTEMAGFNELGNEIGDIAVALSLATGACATFELLDKGSDSPFLYTGMISGGQDIKSARRGDAVALTVESLASFQDVYRRIRTVQTDDRLRALRLPLRRLHIASTRTTNEDHIVDCVIALENLLASDSPQLETTFRFRLRGSALLPETFGNTSERLSLMNRLYNIRSRTVHGAKDAHRGKSEADSDLSSLASEADSVLRAVVMWFLKYVDCPEQLSQAVKDLDSAMVRGGSEWARG